MKIEYQTIEEGNLKKVVPIIPEGWEVVDEHHPCPTVTPWDYYGGKHQREHSKVLTDAGLEVLLPRETHTIIHPVGTGHGGSVRFGDNMLPGVYYIVVESKYAEVSRLALKDYRRRLHEWLFQDGPKPKELR